ncbi:MAG: glycosyltransferase family 1 protein [Alphaproteobacteria bacterium]|nr:glycosyltransferase family 1 protein [Alphaproteobacteria bacterium]
MNDRAPETGALQTAKKVLIVSDAWHPQVNGVVRTYEHICEELEEMGYDVRIIGPADFPKTFPMPGYDEIRLAPFPYRRLAAMMASYRPDHIHAATEGPLGWATRKICLRHGYPFTTTYHTQFPDYAAKRAARYLPFLYKPVHSAAKNYIRRFHAPSHCMMVATQSLEDELKGWDFTVPMHRMTRGVNTDLFYPGPKNLFGDLKRPVALYVGRVAIEKNLEAFLGMEWAGSKVVVGDGPAMAELREKFPETRFAGKKVGHELADHYRSSDLFVFPSKTDTFGIVLIEALACGLPIAGYDVTGPRDIVSEPFLGAVGDDLARCCLTALSCGRPEDRFNHVRANYTWRRAAEQFMEAFA